VTPRSYLHVPGDRESMLAKALARGADAVICDLEDAVPADRKQVARETVARWIADQPQPTAQIWVRVNAESIADDIAAVARGGVTGVSVAKASAELLVQADDALSVAEQRHGLPRSSIAVIPLIETAAALLELAPIAAAPRVTRLAIGEADLCGELGMAPSPGEPELWPLRVSIVVASAAAGLQAPVGPVATDFRDLDALRATTVGLVRLGFRARSAIHPAQVAVINDVLTPAPDEVERAAALVERFHATGAGATTDDSGRMIDSAVVRGAEEVLARAAAARGPQAGA